MPIETDPNLRAQIEHPNYGKPGHEDYTANVDRAYQQKHGGASQRATSTNAEPSRASGPRPTLADLEARERDPKNDPNSPSYDRHSRAELERDWRRLDEPEGSTSNFNSPARETADAVPADFKGYTLANSEKLAPHVQSLEGDDLYNTARKLARDAGISQKQFATFVTPILEKMAEGGGGHRGDLEAEWKALIPAEARDRDDRAQRVAAGRRIEAALDFVERDAVAAGLDPKVAAHVVEQLGSPLGVQALEWFRDRAGGRR